MSEQATTQQAKSTKFCADCGAEISSRAEICPKCGVRAAPPAGTTSSGKNKMVAGLLALFLGGIGAHKFYLGNTKMGIIYLVFFWTAIPALIALVEGIMLLTMSDADFVAKFG